MTGFDKEIVRDIALRVAGTRLAIVVGPSPVACAALVESGFKVFCILSNAHFKPLCSALGDMLYDSVFPITGDHRKVPRVFPIKVDMVFVGLSGDFSARDWLRVVRPGGSVVGCNYPVVKKIIGEASHTRGVWWQDKPGAATVKCAWEMLSDGGYGYLQTIATSLRVSL